MYFCATLDLLQLLKAPLPEHLFERLTVDAAEPDNYRCPLSTDSEMLREYCAALTMLLLQGSRHHSRRNWFTQQPPAHLNVIVTVAVAL